MQPSRTKVEMGLSHKGLEAFLPGVTVRSRHRDRLQMLEVPLFPDISFCAFRAL